MDLHLSWRAPKIVEHAAVYMSNRISLATHRMKEERAM